MSTGWVAGSVRARALARGALEGTAAHAVVQTHSLPAAVSMLRGTPYGRELGTADDLELAQHAVLGTLLWRLRVLAGWVPRQGAELLRVLAAGFELANVDEHVARLEGRPSGPTYTMGRLETAWSRLSRTVSIEDLRRALGASPWRDPGGATAWDVHTGMTLAWAERVTTLPVAAAGEWARAAAALSLLRESLVVRRSLPDAVVERASRLFGASSAAGLTDPATTLVRATRALPRSLRWLWADLDDEGDLWRAEAALRRRVASDGTSLLWRAIYGAEAIVGVVGVLAADAWRIQAALEVAARGGGVLGDAGAPSPVEVFDEMA